MEDLLIIGGGPAGIMAALTAGKKRVTIIDKNPSPGRKILASGNGKCNITNSNLSLSNYRGDKAFLKKVFSKFNNQDLIAFFASLGVQLKEERFGRYLPVTESSATILDSLLEEVTFNKVNLRTQEQVLSLAKNTKGFTIKTGRATYEAKNVLIAAGGCAYPQLGSTRSGYELAEKFGHKISEPRPALGPVELSGNWFFKLQGVRVEAEIVIESREWEKRHQGELLFTKYGISGPVTLDASLDILDNLKEGGEVYINLLPEYKKTINSYFETVSGNRPDKTVAGFLCGFIPKKIVQIIVPLTGVSLTKKCAQLSKEEKNKLFKSLLRWPLKVVGPKPFSEAMASAGGVLTSEIDPETMQSKKVPGLYFAGEVIDVTGLSGGYNMQFAFSTGYIAGKTIASS